MKNYYEILEVDRNATEDEIKKSYRRLMKKYHPDLNKSKEDEEKSKEINEAYSILGDPEKRKMYDLGNLETSSQDEFDYDSLTEEQKEYIEFLRKRKAFEQIVEEELAKSILITEKKSNIEMNGLMGTISNEEYYRQVKSLNNDLSNYLQTLISLQEKTTQYDCYYIYEKIESAKETIISLVNSLPLSLDELKQNEKKEKRSVIIKRKIAEVTEDTNYNINEIANLLIELSQNTINKIDYSNFRESYIIVLNNSITDIEKLLELTNNDSMSEADDLKKLKDRCHKCLEFMNSDISKAQEIGQEIANLRKRDQAINDWFQIYKVKIDKISRILIKYPNSSHYEMLFMYGEKILQEQYDKLYNIRSYFHPQTKKSLINVFLNKSPEELDSFSLAIQIEMHDKKDFEDNFGTLKILRKLPCDIKYYHKEEVIPTIGELIDLYKLNHYLRKVSKIIGHLSIATTAISLMATPVCYSLNPNAGQCAVMITTCSAISVASSIVIHKQSTARDYYYEDEIESKKEYKKILNYKKRRK